MSPKLDVNDVLRRLLDTYNDWPEYHVISVGSLMSAGCIWCSLVARTDMAALEPQEWYEDVLKDPARHDPDCAWRLAMELRDKPPACEGCKWWHRVGTRDIGICDIGGGDGAGPIHSGAQIWAEGWLDRIRVCGNILSVPTAHCSQFEERNETP